MYINYFTDPFPDVRQLHREVDRLFRGVQSERAFDPPLDIAQDADRAVVTVELPGVSKDQINIQLKDQVLYLEGKRDLMRSGEKEVLRRERAAGDFQRTIRLPFRVDSDQTKASLRNGVLTVEVVRAPEDRPKKIAVSV